METPALDLSKNEARRLPRWPAAAQPLPQQHGQGATVGSPLYWCRQQAIWNSCQSLIQQILVFVHRVHSIRNDPIPHVAGTAAMVHDKIRYDKLRIQCSVTLVPCTLGSFLACCNELLLLLLTQQSVKALVGKCAVHVYMRSPIFACSLICSILLSSSGGVSRHWSAHTINCWISASGDSSSTHAASCI